MEKTNLSITPYFDDFNESKNFHRILFRPGFAVQGRELNQLQTILQNQIDRFGSHVFQEGSSVTGAQTNFYKDVTYLKLESTFGGLVIDVTKLNGMELVETSGRGTRARVIAVAAETADPPTLMVRYVSGEEFKASDTLAFSSSPATGVAKIRSESDSIGKGSVATLQEGVFFIRGYFVHTPQQVVILDKYGVTPTYDVGLEITEAVITEKDDTSLLDPALDSSNYQAPGANRFTINLLLNKRAPSSTDLSEFVKLMKLDTGNIIEWVRYPLYNEIEKTLARRTYDESGNYTVKAFRATVGEDASNNNQYIVTLDAGKAYVFGFEFETIAPTQIKVPKPRSKEYVNNYALSMNYGNFVWVANANGFFNTSTFPTIDLHSVQSGNIDFANTPFYSNTKIGTARVRDWVLESFGSAPVASTYQYRAHLFDVNTVSYVANSAGTNNTINSVNLASGYSATTNAYLGTILTVTAGTSVGDRRTVVAYNGTTKIATVDKNFTVIPDANSVITLAFQFKDVESIAIRNITGVNAFADIVQASKDATTTFNDSYLTDTTFDRLVFELPYQFVVATDASNSITGISDVNYEYRKVFTPTLTANTATLNLSGVEQFVGSVGAQSALSKSLNWFIEVVSPNSSTFGKGAIVPVADVGTTITLTGTQTANVTIANGGNSTISVIAIVNVTNGGRKTKTTVPANTTVIAAAGGQPAYDDLGVVVPGVTVFATFGQTDFASTNVIPKTADSDLRLYIPDGITLAKVITSANASIAVSASDLADPSKDITSSYIFDNGQRDGYYAHARIRLKPGVRPPAGQLRVFFSYYDHDVNQGYFSVDSYPSANNQSGYNAVPNYTSSSGKIFALRDCIDFRPRKTIGFANTFSSPVYIGASQTNFNLDFGYYLARIDYLVLTRDRRFEVIRGIDALVPTSPKSRDDAMLLNVMTMPPYVGDAANNINIRSIENKRYTMRDIGALEKRLTSLEYYTSLSLLEQQAMKKNDASILDDMGLERTKNGIIVDSFADFSASDVTNLDWKASIDLVDRGMKPAFNNDNYDLFLYGNGSVQGTFQATGHTITLPWVDASFIIQNVASKFENINPFNVTKWAGTINLNPPNDTWVDTRVSPVITNPQAGLPLSVMSVLWSSWTTLYSGHLTHDENFSGRGIELMYQQGVTKGGLDPSNILWGGSRAGWGTMSAWQGQADGGTDFQIGFETTATRTIQYEEIRTSQGTRILSTTIIPFVRSRALVFGSKNMRPNTAYYPFFDGTPVLNYVRKANVIRLANTPVSTGSFTEETKETYGAPDAIHYYDNYPPAATNFNGTSYLLSYAANVGLTIPTRYIPNAPDWVINFGGPAIANTTNAAVIGFTSFGTSNFTATWKRVVSHEHYSANVQSANSTTIQISQNAHANAYYFAPSIGQRSWSQMAAFTPTQWSQLGEDGMARIVAGTGAGQARQITNYNLVTNMLTVTPAWTTVPDTTSGYSIGLPRSVETGHIGGTFHIPNTSIMQFRTGDRIFKLTDTPDNVDTNSTSIATGRYSASGSMQEVSEDILVTRKVASINEAVEKMTHNIIVIPGDPLAQSFRVDSLTYTNGVFLSRVRVCFKSKDNFLPVRCQIRQMVNGFPSATDFVAETILNPIFVKTTNNPSLNDITKYTDFRFTAPVYLAPGKEYAYVLLSDSNQYNVFVSEMGGSDINTGATISAQPNLGSLFKSQNGSTWTPVQEEDMMFGLYICDFDTTKTANVNFRILAPTANANVDLFYASVSTISPPGCDINYQYSSELISGGLTALKPFVPNQTAYFNDQGGRRIFKAGTNTSFSIIANMTSTNRYVSPAIDISSGLSVFGIEYIINNGELSNTNIVITNGGLGYLATDNSNVTITISGGGGTGATAQVNAISNGVITDIVLTNPGSGYYTTPSISLGFTGNATMRAANTNVAVSVVGETSASGGNSKARYIMKKVKLMDGLDSSDIRVYLTGYRPLGSSVYVYYKVLSGEDPDVFENKNWNVMTQLGNTFITSKNRSDVREFTYAPGSGGVPSKEIIYNGYSEFKTFAVKVVFFSTNTIDVPEFKDIRVIALPSGKSL